MRIKKQALVLHRSVPNTSSRSTFANNAFVGITPEKHINFTFSGLSEGRISLASAGFHNFPTLGTHLEEKYGCKTHRSTEVDGDSSSYLQVLVGFQGPDGGVSEFDVKESLIWAVFVDFATGEPIPMLLSQRCHFYN